MKAQWLNRTEEEGTVSLSEQGREEMRLTVYFISEEEAEASVISVRLPGKEKLQDVAEADNWMGKDIISEKITDKVTKCLIKAFRFLENEGYEEAVLVEHSATKFAEILNSTSVVQYLYSEWMMEKEITVCHTENGTRNCGEEKNRLYLTQGERDFVCTNGAQTFLARLSPYRDGWYLYEVLVEESLRNRGIATDCLLLLEKEALQVMEDRKRIYLQVGSYNEPAVHLYKKLGYRVTEELCYYAIEE